MTKRIDEMEYRSDLLKHTPACRQAGPAPLKRGVYLIIELCRDGIDLHDFSLKFQPQAGILELRCLRTLGRVRNA